MDEEFEYTVYPSAFNVAYSLSSDEFDIERIYGSDSGELPIGDTLVTILSMFPSRKPSDLTSTGGVILVKLKPKTNTRRSTYAPFQYR